MATGYTGEFRRDAVRIAVALRDFGAVRPLTRARRAASKPLKSQRFSAFTGAGASCKARPVLANISQSTRRVSDLLCMSNLVHASPTKEHDNDDDYQGTFRRAAERR